MSRALRVVKTLAPHQAGAIKLSRKHGESLVCVRYRTDAAGSHRYTTIELIVDCVAVVKRPDRMVGVRIEYGEADLRAAIKAAGGTWDASSRVWRLAFRHASALGLAARIVAG